MEPLLSPCGCDSKEEYKPKTHINFRLTFTTLVSFDEIYALIKQLPEHELIGFEVSKW